MKKQKCKKGKRKSLPRAIIIIGLFALWLSWDLSQASNSFSSRFPSFRPERTYDALSSATTKVSIVRSDDGNIANPVEVNDASISYQTIEDMVREAIKLAGGLYMAKPGDMVLLKPNIVDADPSGNGEITDVRVIKALIKIVDEIDPGNMEIVVGEASPVPINYELEYDEYYNRALWGKLWDHSGYQDLLDDPLLTGINLRLSNLNCATPGSDWSAADGWPSDSAWKDLVLMDVPGGGEALPQNGQYWIHKDIINADVFITVPVMKIHSTGITAALKNQIGIAPSTIYGFWKQMGVPQNNYSYKLIHQTEAPLWWTHKEIVDLSNLAGVDFAVIDAIGCLEREKDAKGDGSNFVRMNTIVAGADPVAVDHVCARLMGLNPDDVEHITLAEKVGLGTNDEEQIILKGADLEQSSRRFKKAYYGGGEFGQGARSWLLKGPFPIDGIDEPIDHEFLPNESEISPEAGENDWSEAMYFTDNRIDLENYFDLLSGQKVVSYAACYFDAPETEEAALWIGSDEAIKIYVNGEVVYSYKGTRGFPDDKFTSEKISFQVQEGENRLLVKSLQKFSRYDFCLNICEAESDPNYDGNRIWGLKFKTETLSSGIPMLTRSPQEAEIGRVFPNPFSNSVQMEYTLSRNAYLDISIFNLKGQKVNSLVHGPGYEGAYSISWNGRDEQGVRLPSGIYFMRMSFNNTTESKTLFLID